MPKMNTIKFLKEWEESKERERHIREKMVGAEVYHLMSGDNYKPEHSNLFELHKLHYKENITQRDLLIEAVKAELFTKKSKSKKWNEFVEKIELPEIVTENKFLMKGEEG